MALMLSLLLMLSVMLLSLLLSVVVVVVASVLVLLFLGLLPLDAIRVCWSWSCAAIAGSSRGGTWPKKPSPPADPLMKHPPSIAIPW
uniref:Uncharacterized protein n=1 Tax=Arundo donax TaxID=35708 RepID=A0A0A9CM75_ARUDO